MLQQLDQNFQRNIVIPNYTDEIYDFAATPMFSNILNSGKARFSGFIYVAMRIVSFIIFKITPISQETIDKWREYIEMFYVVHVTENNNKIFNFTPLTRLVGVNNSIQIEVLQNERQDLVMAQRFKNALLSENFKIGDISIEWSAGFRERFTLTPSFQTNGICLGMSLVFAKRVLELRKNPSQEELCIIAREFTKGGNAEMAGLQALQQPLKSALAPELASLSTQIQELKIPDKDPHKQQQKMKDIDQLEKSLQSIEIKRIRSLPSLISLIVNQRVKFGQKSFLEEIEKLSVTPGVHCIDIDTHTITYIKTAENAYIFDPNFGLLSASYKSIKESFKCFLKLYKSQSIILQTLQI